MGLLVLRSSVYTTTFPTIENPLSQDGWISSRDPNQTQCQVTANGVFGTNLDNGTFDDSSAIRLGFGNDYEIEGTIYKAGGGGNWNNQEVELLVRWDDQAGLRSTAYGDTTSNGYEWNVAYDGAYQNLGRWKGDALDSTAPDFTPANGDRMRMRVEGQRIRCYWNDALKIDYTDNDAALKIVTGNPGIGFWCNFNAGGTPVSTNFGFSAITIREL